MSNITTRTDGNNKKKVRNLVAEVAKDWYMKLRYGSRFNLVDLDSALKYRVNPALFIQRTNEFLDNGAEVFMISFREEHSLKIPISPLLVDAFDNVVREADGSFYRMIYVEPMDYPIARIQVFWEEWVSDHFSGYEDYRNVPVMYFEDKFIGNKVIISEATKQNAKKAAVTAAKVSGTIVKESARGLFKLTKFAYQKYKDR